MGVIVLMVLLITLSLIQISSAKEAVIGFRKLVHDRDILSLMHSCKAKIKALWYTTPYGGGGSGRYREVRENSELIKVSRQNLKNMLGKYGYVMTGINLSMIYRNLSAQDIQSSKKLKKYVTGLLNSFFQQKLSYEYIASGKPIYFAVLVDVPSNYISCLERSDLVKDISVNDYPLFRGFLKYISYYLKPKNIPEKYLHPALKNIGAKNIGAEGLYDILRETVKDLESDKLFNRHKNSEEFKDYIIKSGEYYKDLINRLKSQNNLSTHTYFPNEGRLLYTGSTTVRSDGLIWYSPGDWSVERSGYEHDLVARNDYFTSRHSWLDSTHRKFFMRRCASSSSIDGYVFCVLLIHHGAWEEHLTEMEILPSAVREILSYLRSVTSEVYSRIAVSGLENMIAQMLFGVIKLKSYKATWPSG